MATRIGTTSGFGPVTAFDPGSDERTGGPMADMEQTDEPDVEAFRLGAGEWLAANFERRDPAVRVAVRGMRHRTVEDIAVQRRLQRTLCEAGYAAITWP